MTISYLGLLSGNSTSAYNPNTKYVSKITVPVGGIYVGVACLNAQTTSGTGYYKFVIYDDSGGQPNNLIYEGEQQSATAVVVLTWYLNYLYLSAGDYYIGGLFSGSAVTFRLQSLSGVSFKNADTYSDGASDPFGTPDSSPTSQIVARIYYITGNEIGIVKTVGYAVLSTKENIAIAKSVGYAILAPKVVDSVKSFFIIT